MKKLKKIASVLMLAAAVVFAEGCTKPDEPNNGGNNNGGGNNGGGETPEVPTVPAGAVDGKFSINAGGDKVYFSRGNLQWSATNGGTTTTTHAVADGGTAEGTWRFGNPWDFVGGWYGQTMITPGELWEGTIEGSDNCLASATYTGWLDLFSWGTSGWAGGVEPYHPYDIVCYPAEPHTWMWESYIVGGDANNGLVGQYANADWGVYNAISNGGNQPGLWRTLTRDEWEYVINGREGSRWCTAIVNGVKGAILIPDGWDNTAYTLDRINDWRPTTTSNIIDQSTWESTCEPAGLVFLPNTGCRKGYAYWATDHYNTYVSLDLSEGYGNYWASSVYREYQGENTSSICMMTFSYGESGTPSLSGRDRPNGIAVRLVQEVQ